MRAFGEEIKNGCERVRGERRGRLQGGADIPTMDSEFKNSRMCQGVHRDNAQAMITGFVPIVRVEGHKKMAELVPGLAAHRWQVVAKTLSVCNGALGEP